MALKTNLNKPKPSKEHNYEGCKLAIDFWSQCRILLFEVIEKWVSLTLVKIMLLWLQPRCAIELSDAATVTVIWSIAIKPQRYSLPHDFLERARLANLSQPISRQNLISALFGEYGWFTPNRAKIDFGIIWDVFWHPFCVVFFHMLSKCENLAFEQ